MTLTEEQRAVVSLDTGCHLVLAPPGSGKTEMLSQRILRALAAGADPKKMLCATFTNRAAFEMRDRVVGTAGPDRVLPDVGSLHHFCHRFLLSVRRLHPGVTVLDEAQQFDFIREVTDVLREELRSGSALDLKKTHGVRVMSTIQGLTEPMRVALSEFVEEYFALCAKNEASPYPDILSGVAILHQWRIGIPVCYLRRFPATMSGFLARDLLSALEIAYRGLKRKFRAVDFDDLVNETYLHLEKNPLADDDRFDWIQIDEVQDLNPLQWRIVKDLTSSRAVSVYFGDIEQAIFSFLGASSTFFASAVDGCTRHYFRTNFRATPLLLEILMRYSLTLLRSDWDFLPSPFDVRRANGAVRASSSGNPSAVVACVRELLSSGVAENVAILVRTNAAADGYERLVRGLGYRTAKVSGHDLFAYPPMRDFLAFVALFTGNAPRTVWSALMLRFADGIFRSPEARYFVRGLFASGWDPMSLFGAGDPVPSVPRPWDPPRQWAWRHRDALASFRTRVKPAYDDASSALDGKCDFRRLFAAFADAALGESFRYSIRELVPEKKQMEDELHRELTEDDARDYALARMERFFRYVDSVYAHDERPLAKVLAEDLETLSKLKEADLLVGDEKIVISTIHKAKGRQFDAVVIPEAQEVAHAGCDRDHEESRRLLYVAMSRAKRHLALFGFGKDDDWLDFASCFEPGYIGYYLRRAEGGDLSDDWLSAWEVLAADCTGRRCSVDRVIPALASSAGPVVRMAIKALRYLPDRAEARRRWLGFLSSVYAEAAIRTLQEEAVFDPETIAEVRKAARRAEDERVAPMALAYFESGVARAPERTPLLLAAIGDFVYHARGELRLDAATFLATTGIKCWESVIRGSSADFERLKQTDDPEHEETIRALLETRLAEEYERRLREILFARAGRSR